jgi:DNA-binding NarL/FixJ family response regulator
MVLRCRVALLAADGMQNKQIAQHLDLASRTAALWRSRILQLGVAGLMEEALRPNASRRFSPEGILN